MRLLDDKAGKDNILLLKFGEEYYPFNITLSGKSDVSHFLTPFHLQKDKTLSQFANFYYALRGDEMEFSNYMDHEDVLRNFLYYAGFRSSEHISENILRHMVLLHAPVFYAKVCLRMSLNGRRTLLEDCDFNVLENGIPEVWDHIMKDGNRKNERGEIQVYLKSILKAIATSPRQDRKL